MSPELLTACKLVTEILNTDNADGYLKERSKTILDAFLAMVDEEMQFEKASFERFKAQSAGIKLMK